jgi:exonuclease V gamma subunit
MPKLFLSHRLDQLCRHLRLELAEDGRGIFDPRVILVPNRSLKQWLLIQIAKESVQQGVAGCKIVTLHEALELFFAPSGFTEIFCSTYMALKDNEKIASYLQESPRRILQLANQLTHLFLRYGRFCPSLFEPNPKADGWQEELIQALFVKGPLRVFAQMALFSPPVHCFGFDYLPPSIWKAFNFSSIYLFSPCAHYWDDLLTDRERKRIGRYWKKKGASAAKLEELEGYLTKVPPLLANWGRPGRETLKILEESVDEVEEDYQSLIEDSTLGRLQKRLLEFHTDELSAYEEDSSIQISKTGASLLKEVEHLREMILDLVEDKKLLFSDIHVFAPDIQPYAPLIQLVFSDIPYRISDVAVKSFYTQGMHRLFQLDFHPEDLLALFENPAFCKARGWDADFLERVGEWLACSEEELLDRFIFLFPEQQDLIHSADDLEQVIKVCQSLRSDLALLSQPRTLAAWAEFLAPLLQKYLCVDSSNEADNAAWNFFEKSMEELRRSKERELFPFAVVEMLLKRPVPGGQIHASYLHAIPFSSIEEGAILPARALFFIGMTEENFPRSAAHPSLDLSKGYRYDSVDRDRYLFLQALLAAKESLHFSYCHLSPEGTPLNPSSLIQELSKNLDAPIKENRVPLSFESRAASSYFPWPEKPTPAIPQGERTVPISDLTSLARHPWEFYLQKKMGIRFESSDEESFSRETNKILRESLRKPFEEIIGDLPKGICGEALAQKIKDTSREWALRLRVWDLSIETASFRRSCQKERREGDRWEFPSLELEPAAGLKVHLIGEVKTFSTKGFIHSGGDQIDGLLRVWPECLTALVASNKHEIHCLKSGRVRIVEDPKRALNAFLLYYFLAETAPSPLLADWANSILRKGTFEWDEKATQFEDPVWKWVVERSSLPPANLWLENWQEILQNTFSELTKSLEKHASV